MSCILQYGVICLHQVPGEEEHRDELTAVKSADESEKLNG